MSIQTVSGRFLDPEVMDHQQFTIGECRLERLAIRFDPRHPRIDWTAMERDARRALAASARKIEREHARQAA